METWWQFVGTVLASVLASSGFWAYFTKRSDRKSASTKLLIGLAHDRIVHVGISYIKRGYIYRDEYYNFMHYLYEPYSEIGANGLAEKIVDDVKKLQIRETSERANNTEVL